MADYVWTQLYSKKSIHTANFPRPVWSRTYSKYTERVLLFNREVWKIKEEKSLALRDSLDMEIPSELRAFKTDLVKMHSLVTKN
jgi:hypothetical protein